MIGIGTALTIRQTGHATLIKQIDRMLSPIIVADPMNTINNVIIFVGCITTISYFILTREHKGLLKWPGLIGKYFIMIALGANFGRIAMTRFATDIDRIKSLVLTDAIYVIPIFFAFIIILYIYDRKKIK
jgi:hypothetical protein